MPAVVVVGAQWGDEGKGRAIDQLGQDVDHVVKLNSGSNVGRTVVTGGEKFVLHLLPAGILAPGVTPIIDNDVVVDLEILFNEITEITSHGKNASSLLISASVHIIPSYNRVLDCTTEYSLGARQLGTTGRGTGPTYVDKTDRADIHVQNLFDESILCQEVHSTLDQENNLFLKVLNRAAIDADAVVGELSSHMDRVRSMVVGCPLVLNHTLDQGKVVLFEAGQTTMLGIDHGIYLFVTSSSPATGGACIGTGVGSTRIDSVVGVVKVYTTRVEEGPFPTELLDGMGERLRTEGGEYRVTTDRPRRCSWHDAAITRYTAYVNGLTDLVMIKLNVFTEHKAIPVCVAYDIDGITAQEMLLTQSGFHHAVPIYGELPG